MNTIWLGIEDAICGLGEEERELVLLFYYSKMSLEDLALRFSLSEQEIKTQIGRALDLLVAAVQKKNLKIDRDFVHRLLLSEHLPPHMLRKKAKIVSESVLKRLKDGDISTNPL